MRIKPSLELFLALDAAYGVVDDEKLSRLAPTVKARGHLSRADLEEVCRWKSARALPLIRRNTENEVQEVTRLALATESERLRIETLVLLQGVGWPMASVILHWFHEEAYPLMDVRALWSLGISVPTEYSFSFWWKYVETCRSLSSTLGVSMRTVDRALWQYSKKNGGPGTP